MTQAQAYNPNSIAVRTILERLMPKAVAEGRPLAKREVHHVLVKEHSLDPKIAGYTLTNTSQRLKKQGVLKVVSTGLWTPGPKWEELRAHEYRAAAETAKPAPAKAAKPAKPTKAAKKTAAAKPAQRNKSPPPKGHVEAQAKARATLQAQKKAAKKGKVSQ